MQWGCLMSVCSREHTGGSNGRDVECSEGDDALP